MLCTKSVVMFITYLMLPGCNCTIQISCCYFTFYRRHEKIGHTLKPITIQNFRALH